MADIFDALLSTAPVDQAELIKRLRAERELGMAAQLSGMTPTRNLGTALSAGAVKQAQDLVQARQEAYDKEQQRGVALEQSKLANERARLDREQRAEDRAADRALRKSLAEIAAARDKEAKAARDSLSEAQKAVQQRHKEGQRAQLAHRLETSNLLALGRAIQRADAVLNKYPTGNLPGVGGLANITTASLGTLYQSIPGLGDGQEGRNVQIELAPLQNLVALARSGAAVTQTELDRLLRETGINWASGDESARQGIRNLAKMYKQVLRGLLAGYDRELVEEYAKDAGLDISDIYGAAPKAAAGDADVEAIFKRHQ